MATLTVGTTLVFAASFTYAERDLSMISALYLVRLMRGDRAG